MATSKSLSIEDRNLNSVTRISSRKINTFKDIDLTFSKKRSGDIFKKNDAAAVKQAVKNLILTNHFEKPFRPYYGGNVAGLLFELADEVFSIDIESQIKDAIENYEPRVEVLKIQSEISEDSNKVDVTLIFRIINTEEIVEFETQISRLR